jgi:hypothetical protein
LLFTVEFSTEEYILKKKIIVEGSRTCF